MVEVHDYYTFIGLPRTSTWEEVKKKVQKHYLEFQRKANAKGPGSEEAKQRDFWAKALAFFKDDTAKKAYDAQLEAWLNSPAAQEAQAKSKKAAEDFAQKTSGAVELLNRAWRELERGNVPEAMLLAGKALVLDPGSWEAYFALGVANFRSSDLDEAMSCLRSAARLNPKSADVLAGMGEVYERQERWKDAYEQYRRAAAIEPDVLVHQISMGLVCVKAGVPDEGIEILRACQAKDPDDPSLNWVLGIALAESARLGWTYVPDGHPRVTEGWYAMSRVEAMQAVEKLNEANSLKIDDSEIVQELAEVRIDVEKNVKRKFIGNWVLFGLIVFIAMVNFGGQNVGAILLLLLAAGYYGVNLAPQYTINARVLKGDSTIKRGFFGWIENTEWWLQLAVYAALFALLPVFMVYWGIRNWTGVNAPLGKALGDIHAKYSPLPKSSGGSDPSVEAQTSFADSLPVSPQLPPTPTPTPTALGSNFDDISGDPATQTNLSTDMPAETLAVLSKKSAAAAAVGNISTASSPAATKAFKALALAHSRTIMFALGAIVLVLALGALYSYRSKNDEMISVGIEQKRTNELTAGERLSTTTEQQQPGDAQPQSDQGDSDGPTAAEPRTNQQAITSAPPSSIPAGLPPNSQPMGGSKPVQIPPDSRMVRCMLPDGVKANLELVECRNRSGILIGG